MKLLDKAALVRFISRTVYLLFLSFLAAHAHDMCVSAYTTHSINALSQQAAQDFARIIKYAQSNPNISYSNSNQVNSSDYSSQVTLSAASDTVAFSCSTDAPSCFFLARDSVNIVCGIVGAVAGAIDRLCSSRERYTEKEVCRIVEESLYAIDQTRLTFYQQIPVYAQAVRRDLYYLEEMRQEMRLLRELTVTKNSHYHNAYSEIETRISRIVQALYNGQETPSFEQKQRELILARRAVDFIQAQKCKDTKQKQQLIAEYAAALATAEHEYAACVAQVEGEKKRKIVEQKQQELFATHVSALTYYLEEQKACAVLLSDTNESYSVRLKKRLALVAQQKSSVTTVSYTIAEHTALTLKAWDHDDISITSNTGNQYQQLLHQELIDILDKTVALPHYSPLRLQQQALVASAVSAVMYNQAGLAHTATLIADFCWALLDYGSAIVEGATLGVAHAAHTIITHPVDTAFTLVAGQYMLAYQLSTLLYTAADIGVTFCYDAAQATEKWDACIKPITDLYDALTDKELSNRDTIKTATALAVGLYAHTKLLGGLKKFCTGLLDGINIFQRVCKNGTPQEYLSTPQGALYKAFSESSEFQSQKHTKIAEKLDACRDAIPKQSKKEPSLKGLIKDAQLPTEGKIRYVPPKKHPTTEKLPQVKVASGRAGYRDRFGNVWVRGDSRTQGESFEWDVQLSASGKRQLGWMTRDNKHLNVSLKGRVTHK